MRNYWARVGTIISQALNVILFNGHPDESLSARAYRSKNQTLIRFIDTVFFWEPNHCFNAFVTDVDRAQELLAGETWR